MTDLEILRLDLSTCAAKHKRKSLKRFAVIQHFKDTRLKAKLRMRGLFLSRGTTASDSDLLEAATQ
jgi:hypothetical protein